MASAVQLGKAPALKGLYWWVNRLADMTNHKMFARLNPKPDSLHFENFGNLSKKIKEGMQCLSLN